MHQEEVSDRLKRAIQDWHKLRKPKGFNTPDTENPGFACAVFGLPFWFPYRAEYKQLAIP